MTLPPECLTEGNISHSAHVLTPRHQNRGLPRPGLFAAAHFVLAVLVVIWLGSGVGSVLLAQLPGGYRWAIAGVWIVTSFLSLRHTIEFASTVWPLAVFIALALLALPPGDAPASAYVQNLAYVLVAYCIYSFYSALGYHRYRRAIVVIVLLDVAVVAIRTWSALQRDPGLSRLLATGNVYEDIRASTGNMWGLGGYPFAYSLPAIMLVFLHHATTGRRYRLASLAVVLLGTLLLVKMAFTIAVILWVAFGLLLLVGETIGRRHQGGLVLVGLFTTSLGILFGPFLLLLLARSESVPNVMAVRLEEVASLMTGELSSQSDIASRFDRYGASLHSLSNNWVTGSMGAGFGMGPVGGHSTWLDTLGAFGLVSLLLFIFLLKVLQRQLSATPSSGRFALKIAWTYFAVLGIINTLLFAHLLLVWLVLLPFTLQPNESVTLEGCEQ